MGRRGCDIECFVTEVMISRLRLTTQANGEKSLETSYLLKLHHQFLKNYVRTATSFETQIQNVILSNFFRRTSEVRRRNIEKKAFESTIFPRFWGFLVVSTYTVRGYSVSLPLRRVVAGVAT